MTMTDVLREYHRVLGEAVFPETLTAADYLFWTSSRHRATSAGPAIVTIWDAHVARVKGEGSPALCDEALAQAIKEIGP